MVTISHLVKKIINSRPLLYEALSQNIVNYANLAELLKPALDAELGQDIKETAIIMALRRYGEHISQKEETKIPFQFNPEIIMKTGLTDLTLVKCPSLLTKLKKIYDLIDYDKGETLNVIQGNYEVTIVVAEKHHKKILSILKDEKIINIEKNLVSLAMSFSKDFLYTPGILAKVTKRLLWENVNVFENISTMTELIFIVSKKDAIKAYNALQGLVEGPDKEKSLYNS